MVRIWSFGPPNTRYVGWQYRSSLAGKKTRSAGALDLGDFRSKRSIFGTSIVSTCLNSEVQTAEPADIVMIYLIAKSLVMSTLLFNHACVSGHSRTWQWHHCTMFHDGLNLFQQIVSHKNCPYRVPKRQSQIYQVTVAGVRLRRGMQLVPCLNVG